eukprot:3423998-Amphidinium_carterae.5
MSSSLIGCRGLEQRSDVFLSSGLNAGRNVTLHANVGGTDFIELCPRQRRGRVDGFLLRNGVASWCLGVTVPVVLPL